MSNSWISDNSIVKGNISITGNSAIAGNTILSGNMIIGGNTSIELNSELSGTFLLLGEAHISKPNHVVNTNTIEGKIMTTARINNSRIQCFIIDNFSRDFDKLKYRSYGHSHGIMIGQGLIKLGNPITKNEMESLIYHIMK
ncbi:hypothetical protein D3C81_1029320 [compost metagenome]